MSFLLHGVPVEERELAGLTLAPFGSLAAAERAAKFDLTLELIENGPGLITLLEFRRDLFDSTTAARMLGHFAVLVAALAAAPEGRLAELPLLPEGDRHQILVEWNDTQAASPEAVLLHQLFEAAAERSPAAVAAVCAGEELSYGELEARSNRMAWLLRERGVGRGAPVGVWIDRSLHMLAAVLGVLKAGAHYVALDETWPAARVESILAASGARALITGSSLLSAAEEMSWRLPVLSTVLCPAITEVEPPAEAIDPASVRELWDLVAERAVDRVTAGGFVSAFTGAPMSEAEVDEYRDRVLSLAAPWLRPEARVLEIGNGSGLLLWEMAARVRQVTGIDPSPLVPRNATARGRRREGYSNVELLTGFAHEARLSPRPRRPGRAIRSHPPRQHRAVLPRPALSGRRGAPSARPARSGRRSADRGRTRCPAAGGAAAGHRRAPRQCIDSPGAVPRRGLLSRPRRGGPPPDGRFLERAGLPLRRAAHPGEDGVERGGAVRGVWRRLRTGWHLDRCASGRVAPEATAADLGDIAYVIHTSGSTGEPKGIAVQHRPAVQLVDWINRTFAIGPQDRGLFVTSLGFDLSVYDIFGVLAAGGTVYVATREELGDPDRLVRLLRSGGITLWDSAPAALVQLAPLFPAAPNLSSRLRRVLLSGDWIPVTLPDRVRQAFPGAQVLALGGATEATVWSNWFPVGVVDPAWPSIPYGRPIANARYHVLDAGFTPSPIGVAGDLYIGGDCLCVGYARRPDLTAEAFLPDPFAASQTARDPASTAPATGRATTPTATWSSWAGWTSRSRCAASASSWGRSRSSWGATPGCGSASSWCARTWRETAVWWPMPWAGAPARRAPRSCGAIFRPDCPST